MIAIIDYDAGNIKSVEKALLSIGETPVLTRDPEVILQADHIILPGVGSFGDAMENLNKFGLIDVIHEAINRKIPFLGICLGLQLLFESSEETPGVAGLGILKGKIVRIPEGSGLKIPHMGWNSLNVRKGAALFKGLEKEPYVYFVHSFRAETKDENISCYTMYNEKIPALVHKGFVYGAQFHPEKSGSVGLGLLERFADLAKIQEEER